MRFEEKILIKRSMSRLFGLFSIAYCCICVGPGCGKGEAAPPNPTRKVQAAQNVIANQRTQPMVQLVGESVVNLDNLKDKPIVSIAVTEDEGDIRYSGVSLRVLLAAHASVDTMEDMRKLTDAFLVVKGADGFIAIVPAAPVAADKAGTQYLLATQRDGKPVEGNNPRLIVPGDAKRVRWVRDVVSVSLLRLELEAGNRKASEISN